MKLVTTWGGIKQGDTVSVDLWSTPQKVRSIMVCESALEVVLAGEKRTRCLTPRHPVILGRRPWPEGKTEADMLHEIRRCAFRAVEPGRDITGTLAELREALEAYELGKQ